MYISISSTFALDEIIKSFEVAFRSFIAKELKDKYKDGKAFHDALLEMKATHSGNTAIFSQRNQAKINKIISSHKEFYNTICDCNQSYIQRDFNNDVPYVSSLVDYISLFFHSCFTPKKITAGFLSLEEFHFNCALFTTIRNSLSHPASTKILRKVRTSP